MSITLRFVTDNSATSALIRRGEYGIPFPTHVEAKMPEGSLLGAHINGGVVARPADYDAATWTTEHFVELACTLAQAAEFYRLMRSQLGKPYDLQVIAAIAASFIVGQRDWRQPDHWICSELVGWALEGAGIIKPLPTAANHLTPRDIYLICAAIADIGQPEIRAAT